MDSSWYAAKLVHYSDIEGSPRKSKTTDEIVVLIRAKDAEDAYRKAQSVGRKKTVTYKNVYGEKVRWKFLGVAGLCKAWDKELKSGSEIYYELHRRKDPAIRKRRLIPDKRDLLAFRD